jgi:uncharacterized protein (UPF0261 family)
VPQVVSVGALDMVNFHGMDSVPAPFRSRKLHRHNENVTLMRTTPEENRRIGEDLGRKVAAARSPTVVFLPRRGLSAIDRDGQPFHDPEARRALYESIRRHAGAVPIEELDLHINDAPFAEAVARKLIELMKGR